MQVHLVFVSTYRRGVFDDEMLRLCEGVMRQVCGDFEAPLTEFNRDADHVHLLVHHLPKVAVSGSSGGAPLTTIERYVEQQNRPR